MSARHAPTKAPYATWRMQKSTAAAWSALGGALRDILWQEGQEKRKMLRGGGGEGAVVVVRRRRRGRRRAHLGPGERVRLRCVWRATVVLWMKFERDENTIGRKTNERPFIWILY